MAADGRLSPRARRLLLPKGVGRRDQRLLILHLNLHILLLFILILIILTATKKHNDKRQCPNEF